MPPKTTPPLSPPIHQEVSDLKGRMTTVETRVGAVEKRQDAFERLVSANTNAMQAGAQISAENNLLLNKIHLFVSGQQTPGLEVPGIAERIDEMKRQMEESATANANHIFALQASVSEMKTADTARKGWIAGAVAVITLVGGGLSIYFYDFWHKLYLLVTATPLK